MDRWKPAPGRDIRKVHNAPVNVLTLDGHWNLPQFYYAPHRATAAQGVPLALQARVPVGSTGRCGILLIALPSALVARSRS